MRLKNRSVEVLVGVFSVLTLALTATAAPAPAPTTLSTIAIDNFGRVNDHYYRGGQPQGEDYTALASLGVKTDIDLTADGDAHEAADAQSAGMKFVRIPLTTHSRPDSAAVAQFLQLVNDPANQPVYVHCQGGHHRTGIMTAVYRMTQDGWTADRAFAEMQHYGFGPVFLHATLHDFVYDYYAHMDTHPVATTAAAVANQ